MKHYTRISICRIFRALVALSICAAFSLPVCAAAVDCDMLSGSHLEQVQCISKRIQLLDGELNRVYLLALKALPERDIEDRRKDREQLRKSQRAWLKYKDENCILVGGLEGGISLWVTHFAMLCGEQEIKDRIRFLNGISGDLSKP